MAVNDQVRGFRARGWREVIPCRAFGSWVVVVVTVAEEGEDLGGEKSKLV